jgi:hypothetical protein
VVRHTLVIASENLDLRPRISQRLDCTRRRGLGGIEEYGEADEHQFDSICYHGGRVSGGTDRVATARARSHRHRAVENERRRVPQRLCRGRRRAPPRADSRMMFRSTVPLGFATGVFPPALSVAAYDLVRALVWVRARHRHNYKRHEEVRPIKSSKQLHERVFWGESPDHRLPEFGSIER